MNKLILHLVLALSMAIPALLTGQEADKAIQLNKNLPQPPHREVLNNPSSQAAQLKALLKEGKLREFYLSARPLFKKMNPVKDEDFTKETLADRLWVYYYYSAAPDLPTDTEENMFWADGSNQLDFGIKDSLGRFIARHDPPLLSKRLPYRKQELAELLATYYAAVMNTFYTNYDPLWKGKEKAIREKVNIPKMNAQESTSWNNKLNMTNSRNNMVGHRLRFQEKDFMKFLMLCFPGNASMIKKYIAKAGYPDDEVEELIILTLGRNAQTEFLLKSLPNKKMQKKTVGKRQAVPRDVAL